MMGDREKSDRGLSADPPIEARADDAEALRQSEKPEPELYDETIQRRFGKVISAAVVKPRKRRR